MLHSAQLRVADLQAEGLLGDAEEGAALIGEGDLEFADAGARGGELLLAEEFLHGEGGVLRGVHEGDIGTGVAMKRLPSRLTKRKTSSGTSLTPIPAARPAGVSPSEMHGLCAGASPSTIGNFALVDFSI